MRSQLTDENRRFDSLRPAHARPPRFENPQITFTGDGREHFAVPLYQPIPLLTGLYIGGKIRLHPLPFWPSIRTKAMSRTKMSCPVFVTPRVSQRRLRTKTLVSHAESPLGGANRSTNHRYGPALRTIILPCEHPAAGSVRKWKTRCCVFQGAFSAVFCTDQSGCESAQSVFRSSFR